MEEKTGMVSRDGTGAVVTLDELAGQMRFYADGSRNDYLHMCMNLLQCGRVMTEAKGRVPHGQWEQWVEENSGFSFRTAEQYMQAYQTYGLNPDIARLGKTKMVKLLPVPEDVRERVMAEHDLGGMSTREFDRVLREAREKAKQEAAEKIDEANRLLEVTRKQAEAMAERAQSEAKQEIDQAKTEIMADALKQIQQEREARAAAERRALEAENRPPEIPEGFRAELENARETAKQREQEIQRLAEAGRETLDEQRRLSQENARLQSEIREQEALLQEQQEALNRAQEDLLNLQSAQARGEEHVYTDELTLDVFGAAVREFIGICARMPHMGQTFAQMDNTRLNEYFQLLKTVEGWADGARKAIESVTVKGGVVVA